MNLFIDIQHPTTAICPQIKGVSQANDNSALLKSGNIKSAKNQKRTTNEEAKYHWNQIEQKRYVKFLQKKKEILELPSTDKRRKKIYHSMSSQVKMRDHHQCKAHHQKMLSKYSTLNGIIKEFSYLMHHDEESISQKSQQRAGEKEDEKVLREGTKQEILDPKEEGEALEMPEISHLIAINNFESQIDYDISDCFS